MTDDPSGEIVGFDWCEPCGEWVDIDECIVAAAKQNRSAEYSALHRDFREAMLFRDTIEAILFGDDSGDHTDEEVFLAIRKQHDQMAENARQVAKIAQIVFGDEAGDKTIDDLYARLRRLCPEE